MTAPVLRGWQISGVSRRAAPIQQQAVSGVSIGLRAWTVMECGLLRAAPRKQQAAPATAKLTKLNKTIRKNSCK
jgi:hypothetical protein